MADAVQPMAFVEMQRILDAGAPWGSLNYWKSNFVRRFDDGVIDALLQTGSDRPSPMSVVLIEHVHGAAARVAPEATAFVRRGDSYNVSPLAIWLDSSTNSEQVAWARRCADAIARFGTGEAYVNYLDQDEQDRVPTAYGANYARLRAVKRAYDPDNFFRFNQNITPESA
jgi:FAD/FMN-containing dehydrogenase